MLCVCLCLAVWLCINMSSGNMVLMRLLQIGAKDLTVACGELEEEDRKWMREESMKKRSPDGGERKGWRGMTRG